MKVGLLTINRFLDTRTGQGIPRYVCELLKNFNEINSNTKISKIPITNIKYFGDAFSLEFNTLFKNLNTFDIIHNPVGFHLLHTTNKKYKYIVTMHDLNPIQKKTMMYDLWYNIYFKRATKYNIDISDHIIADSTQTKSELIRSNCNNKKITVVNLGVDKRFMKFSKTHENNGVFKVGYIGSFVRNKNVEMAIKAFNYISKDVSLDIYGKRTELYENHLNLSKFNKKIHFKGFAPEKRLVEIYDSFDAFVFPSLYEGFGLPILEAQSRGIPVIIYKDGKITDEVRKYCFEAKNPEHMAQIITDLKENGYNKKMMKKATEYARMFTWEKTAKETYNVYEKIYSDGNEFN